MKNNDDLVKRFIEFIKDYDESKDDPVTTRLIEEFTNYSKRQFDRIFKRYSNLTPFEIAEKFRLLRCIENIKDGNTLVETAYCYGYTPEGLSNALRSNFKLTVKQIQDGSFELAKHIKISTAMVQLDNYKYRIEKEMYFEFLEGLDDEKILSLICSDNSDIRAKEGFEIHLHYSKVMKIISEIEGVEIEKEMYEHINYQEPIAFYPILINQMNKGNYEFKMRVSECASITFITTFFFEVSELNLRKGNYIFEVNPKLKELLDGIKEFNELNEIPLPIILKCSVEADFIIVGFDELNIWYIDQV